MSEDRNDMQNARKAFLEKLEREQQRVAEEGTVAPQGLSTSGASEACEAAGAAVDAVAARLIAAPSQAPPSILNEGVMLLLRNILDVTSATLAAIGQVAAAVARVLPPAPLAPLDLNLNDGHAKDLLTPPELGCQICGQESMEVQHVLQPCGHHPFCDTCVDNLSTVMTFTPTHSRDDDFDCSIMTCPKCDARAVASVQSRKYEL